MPTIHAMNDDGQIRMSVVRHENVEKETRQLLADGYTIKEID